ncbi:MAG: YggS family pyridoxal phosphate-dependent enzyme, partial [Bryobacteraceae bacterium]
MSTETHSITANIERIRERLARAAARAGRGAAETTIVAASKTFPAEAIREAFEAGVREFGENRVQEW